VGLRLPDCYTAGRGRAENKANNDGKEPFHVDPPFARLANTFRFANGSAAGFVYI
jgi:hypothetical protein